MSQRSPVFPGLPLTQLEERLGLRLAAGELVYQWRRAPHWLSGTVRCVIIIREKLAVNYKMITYD